MLKGRLEDDRMLTGRGKYVSDWNLPGQAYGHFLRSDRAHADIASLDAAAALAHPGVIAVFTGEDIRTSLKSLPCALPVKGRGGMELIHPGRPALAQGRVRFTGDAVALVIAESAAAAADAAELINVEYRDRPAVVGAAEAVQSGAPLVHDSVPGNMVLDYESGDDAGSKAAFAKAARTIELEVDISRVIGNPMEPRACLAHFDTGADQYHLYSCTQGAGIMRNQLSAVLGVPPEKIRVIAEEVGGGFGVRFNVYPEYCAALFAAKKLGRPVKWTGTRSEVFLADEQARDVRSRGALAVDSQGKILGMRFDMLANLGGYQAPTGPFINTIGIINCLSGVYDVPASYARIRLALTNTAPMAAYRGAGRPIMSYALERLVEQAARRGPGFLYQRQCDRRLALAAGGRRRDLSRRTGAGEERSRACSGSARGRAGGHRVRGSSLPHQRHRSAHRFDPAREEAPGPARSRVRQQVRRLLSQRLPYRRSRDHAGDRRSAGRLLHRLRRRRQHHQSPDRRGAGAGR